MRFNMSGRSCILYSEVQIEQVSTCLEGPDLGQDQGGSLYGEEWRGWGWAPVYGVGLGARALYGGPPPLAQND